MTLSASYCHPSMIAPQERDDMYQLLNQNFVGVDPTIFNQDLMKKSVVFLLKNNIDRLKGFSTAEVFEHVYRDRRYRVVFSGDTIVNPDSWGSTALPVAWLSWALSERTSETELLWFLISKGVRTYKFLPTFCREFYPSVDNPAHKKHKELIHDIAKSQFGEIFDETRGVLKVFQGSYALKPSLAEISINRRKNKHVQFFLQRNPRYREGEELVCSASLSISNIRPYLLRHVLKQGSENAYAL